MKRNLFFAILLCCVFAVTTCFAESITEMSTAELYQLYEDVVREINNRNIPVVEIGDIVSTEIEFRGISWMSSPADYITAASAAGITGTVRTTDATSWESTEDDGDLVPQYDVDDAGFYISSSPKGLIVAGYPVSNVRADFMIGSDDENVYSDEAHAKLYKARYTFDVVDKKATYSILLHKLNSLYGEGVSDNASTHWWSTGGDYSEYSDWTIWYGANDTAVILHHHHEVYDKDNAEKSSALYLTYGKSNSILLLHELEAAMAREQAESAANSLDGL